MDELDKLYQVVSDKGLYTKSLDEFKEKYSAPENQQKLYKVVNEKGLYTKSEDEFKNKYFTQQVDTQPQEEVPVKKKSSAVVSGSSDSSLDSKSIDDTTPIDVVEHQPGLETYFRPEARDYETLSDREKLYVDMQRAKVPTEQQLADVDQTVADEAKDDFGLLEKVKKFVTTGMGMLPAGVPGAAPGEIYESPYDQQRKSLLKEYSQTYDVPQEEIDEKELRGFYLQKRRQELVDKSEEENLTNFIENLTKDQVKELQFYEGSKIAQLNTKDKYRQFVIDESAEKARRIKEDIESGVTQPSPELIQEYDDNIETAYGMINEMAESQEDIMSSKDELDLLKRNYGKLENLVGKASASTLEIMANVSKFHRDMQELTGADIINQPAQLFASEILIGQEIPNFQEALEEATRAEAVEVRGGLRKPISVTDISGINDLANWTVDLVGEQTPNTLLLATTGGAGLAVMGASAYGNKLNELETEEELGLASYTPFEKRLSAAAVGGAEILSERVSLGILNKSKRYIRSLSDSGIKELKGSLGKRIKDSWLTSAKLGTAIANKEGMSEIAAQLSENMVDKYYLDKDVSLYDNLTEAYASGAAMGLLYGSPQIGGSLIKPFVPKDVQQKLGENLKKVDDLNTALENASESEKNIIAEQIAKIDATNDAIVKEQLGKVSELSREDIDKVLNTERDLHDLRKQYTDVVTSTNLADPQKQQIISSLNEDYKTKTKNKFDIINNPKRDEEVREPQPEGQAIREETTADTGVERDVQRDEQAAEISEEAPGTEAPGDQGRETRDQEEVEEAPTIKETTKQIADKLRQSKFYKSAPDAMNKLQSDPTGLLKVAWDGAVETVATTIEAGGTMAQAVNNAVKHVKGSDWYKNLSKEGQKSAIEILKSNVEENVSPYFEAQVKVKEAPKKTIRKTTGQTDVSKKVTTTESKLLRQKFKDIQRGFKAGQQEFKATRNTFTKLVTSTLKKMPGVFSRAETSRLLSAVNSVNEKNFEKVDKVVQDFLQKIENREKLKSLKSLKKKVSKKGKTKSKRIPVNVKELLQKSTNINEKYLDTKDINTYNSILDKLYKATLSDTSKNYQMIEESDAIEQLNDLRKKAEKAYIKQISEEFGLESENLTLKEIEEILTSENADEYIDNLSEAKQKEARTQLERRSEYAQLGLKEYFNPDLTEQESRDLRILKNADFKDLSSETLKRYIINSDNVIVNDSFASTYDVVSEIKADRNINSFTDFIKKNKINLSNIKRSTFTDLKSLALQFKDIFGNQRVASIFNKESGLLELDKSYTKVKRTIKDTSKRYDEVVKKSLKKNNSLSNFRNTLYRGVTSQLIQGSTQEDFKTNKSRMEQHIDRMSNSAFLAGQNAKEAVQGVYNEFKNLNSQEEVIEYVKNKNDGNWELVDFWIKEFDKIKDDLKYNTEVVHGELFSDFIDNYLPLKMKGIVLPKDIAELDKRATFSFGGVQDAKQSPTTLKRTKSKRLPEGRFLDLDFDSVMFDRMQRTVYDIETSRAIKDVSNFLSNPKINDVFSNETIQVFTDKFREMRELQMGLSQYDHSALNKRIRQVEKTARKVATTIALGGLTQYPKQYTSVATNAAIRLGKDAGLLFNAMTMNKSNIPLLDMFSISQRGETEGGTLRAGDKISEAEKRQTARTANALFKAVGKGGEKVREALFYSLRRGDVNIARSTWVAFYQEYLRNKGYKTSDIDMRTEHLKYDKDEIRQEAASYAQLMVEETQIASDEGRQSSFYANRNTWKSIIKGLFLPYQSFNINSKIRTLVDLKNLSRAVETKDSELLKDSAQSLAGTITELLTFQTMKYFMLAPLLQYGKQGIADLLGFGDDEDEFDWEFKFKQWYSALAKDLNPLAIGVFAEDVLIETLNYMAYLTDKGADENIYEWTKRKRGEKGSLPFYRYGDKPGFNAELIDNLGLYGAPINQISETLDSYELGFGEYPQLMNEYGATEDYYFTDEEKNYMQFMFFMDLMTTIGTMEADSYRTLKKIQRELKQKAK